MLALVTGTGRSGTTLVQETLSRHPATGFISGLDDKLPRLNMAGRFNGRIYRRTAARDPKMRALSESTRLLERGRLRIAPSEAYGLLDRHVFSGFSTPCRDLLAEDLTPFLERRLQEFFTARIQAQGCDVLVQHLTGWPRTGFIRAAVPDTKVVNVVRDGRAVASSWLQMGWWDGWRGPDNWDLRAAAGSAARGVGGLGPLVRRTRRAGLEDAHGGVRRGSGPDARGRLDGRPLRGRVWTTRAPSSPRCWISLAWTGIRSSRPGSPTRDQGRSPRRLPRGAHARAGGRDREGPLRTAGHLGLPHLSATCQAQRPLFPPLDLTLVVPTPSVRLRGRYAYP